MEKHKNVYIVTKYENYMFRQHYEPSKRAFLSEQEVKDFLTDILRNDYPERFLTEYVNQIEKLKLNLHVLYGDYRYETDVIPLTEFKDFD